MRLVMAAWLLRLAVIIVFAMTNAIYLLRLSPDSERYHAYGVNIMQQMDRGSFNWPNWIDNGWFQFTGLVYYLFGPYPFLIQLVNITLSSLTVILVYRVAREVSDDPRVWKMSAVLTAFFPSFVYWSVLMLKDPAAIFALALVVHGTTVLRRRFEAAALVGILLGLLIFLGTREYLFFVLIFLIAGSLLLFPHHASRTLPLGVAMGLIVATVPMVMGFGFLGLSYIENSAYFDLDYINHVRRAMGDHGTGALFAHDDVHVWGKSIVADLSAIAITVFSVFFPVNPADVGSARQLMALPELLIIVFLIKPLYHGVRIMWQDRRNTTPVLIICFGVLAVYVAGTTNAGALFRWKTQIMPYFFIMMAIGLFHLEKGMGYRLVGRLFDGRAAGRRPAAEPVRPLLS